MDSKSPDEELIFKFIDGDPRARVIVDSWRFRQPITVLPADEFDALVSRSRTVFAFARQAEGDSEGGQTPDSEW